jgi:hypothetical protein
LFSVALSLGSPPPAVSRHRIPVEPGLSSMPRETEARRPSGRLTEATWEFRHGGVKRGDTWWTRYIAKVLRLFAGDASRCKQTSASRLQFLHIN